MALVIGSLIRRHVLLALLVLLHDLLVHLDHFGVLLLGVDAHTLVLIVPVLFGEQQGVIVLIDSAFEVVLESAPALECGEFA